MEYNDLAKALMAKLDLSRPDIPRIWLAGGRKFSKSRSASYFKGRGNKLYLTMGFIEFRDFLTGLATLHGFRVKRPEDFAELKALIVLLMPDLGDIEGDDLDTLTNKLTR